MTSSPSPSPTGAQAAAVVALQDALLTEHAAVHGYGFAAAKLTGERHDLYLGHMDEHRAGRDALRAELVDREAVPAAGEQAYTLPEDTGEESLASFAVGLEEATAQAYLELAAVSDPALRDLAGRALRAATVRALDLGAPLSAFPGFPGGEL
ncbi:ferritin-like domain-containing protein [Actinorugispora endophytica]|uniref:Uncharacterized protein DUF4439 n=1 Tax=Actinorugispora endophytica TaxID=1605990 RepID=A0A4R6V785_9ACTN|nr:ferritin-like domain-containing protein [Actinorugispora endophytica]TDQ52141.1 uncharacterized protein DUF4439 [Actinorugispora endophytica]